MGVIQTGDERNGNEKRASIEWHGLHRNQISEIQVYMKSSRRD
jgi:hypothetical protein